MPVTHAAVEAVHTDEHPDATVWQRIRARALAADDDTAPEPWSPWVVLGRCAALAATAVAQAIPIVCERDGVSRTEWMQVAGPLVSAALIVAVLVSRRRSRARAYRWVERCIPVDILVTEVCALDDALGSATVGIAVDTILLIAVRIIARNEALRDAPATLPDRLPLGL